MIIATVAEYAEAEAILREQGRSRVPADVTHLGDPRLPSVGDTVAMIRSLYSYEKCVYEYIVFETTVQSLVTSPYDSEIYIALNFSDIPVLQQRFPACYAWVR